MIAPVLGYPSRTAAIEAMLGEGRDVREIVAAIGGSRNSVRKLIWQIDQRVGDRKIVLPRDVTVELACEASARGVSPQALALELLTTIARDKLFDALLGERGALDA